MLQEPLFLDSNHIALFETRLQEFLLAIFSQPYERSFRRGMACLALFEQRRYKRYMAVLGIGKKLKSLIRFKRVETFVKDKITRVKRALTKA